jgi:hypothetical protein
MPADYQVIDATGALVWRTLPYSRPFVPSQRGSPVLLLWVKTGYTSPLSAASIRINGTEITKISPRPWTDHNIINLEAIAVPFSSSLLALGRSGCRYPIR